MQKVDIYIDGSCSGNPGPGGFAAVCPINGKLLAACGHVPQSTNNQAELRAAIKALTALKVPCEVTLCTDSQYLVTCWNHDKESLTNIKRVNHELWFEFIEAAEKGRHVVKFVKIKGHSGNKYNEIADRLAKAECAKERHLLCGGA